MSTYSCQLSKNKGLMLNRFTARPNLTQYIESCAITEEVEANHSFHKIMVDKWTDDNEVLFHTLSNYFESSLIPINTLNVGNITSFYTSNLNLILKIINLDFKFPYARSTYHLSIIFNEKTSVELFGSRKTLEDIVCDVINRRFNKNQELDLSKMSKDQEFLEYKINFYHLSLLSHFKTLMLRVGKETKSLNLSKNNLKKIPLEILNFFIKGDLTSIDLSYNKIQSLSDLSRVSSKIEKLWIEGNPLCDDIEPNVYVRNVISKFPRLIELDGIKLNDYGTVPIRRNYLATPDNVTKLVVERFLITFFSLYDDKKLYKSNSSLYDDNATFTLTTDYSEVEHARYGLLHYLKYSRNFLNSQNDTVNNLNKKIYDKKNFTSILQSQPATLHDPYTFTVDVLKHDVESLILVVGGVFKEVKTNKRPEIVCKFRRTFVLAIHPEGNSRAYCIKNDMLYIALASPDEINNSFKYPIINFNTLALINPNHEEIEALVKAFMKITNLKRTQAEIYLKLFGWDIYAALNRLRIQVKSGELPRNNFIDEEDDFSDASSTLDID